MPKLGRPNIQETDLLACLRDQYGLNPVTLDYLPLGLDYDAGVYRVADEQGNAYLLKAQSRPLYMPSYLIPSYLHDQGIPSVVAPFATAKKTLWARMGAWTVILYPFIEGETGWTGMTDEQWKETGAVFKRIHRAALPAEGFAELRTETFDPTEYRRWEGILETRLTATPSEGAAEAEAVLRSAWLAHQAIIHEALVSLDTLAERLRRRSGPYVICHADLHPGNLIRDPAGGVYVVDWDEVMLAPKERDFIFVQQPQMAGDIWRDIPPFFQGYGQAEIDWIALTYYLWERVIQDVIECARSVYFRSDWGDEEKADAIVLFEQVVDGGLIIRAAQAAAKMAGG